MVSGEFNGQTVICTRATIETELSKASAGIYGQMAKCTSEDGHMESKVELE